MRELFKALRAREIKIILASSSAKEELGVYKRLARIEELVDAETSKNEVQHTKPAPDIFALALKGAGPIERVRVIGDSPFDIEAARKVGIPAIAVRSGGFPEQELRDAGCIDLYNDPEDLLLRIDGWTRD